MSTSLAIPEVVGMADVILAAIAGCDTPEAAHDATARVAAARAWAKTHQQLRDYRLTLLELEVAALVRVIELDGAHLLKGKIKAVALALAALSPDARAQVVQTSGTTTTATGMYERHMMDVRNAEESQTRRQAGRDWATGDRTLPSVQDQIDEALSQSYRLGDSFEVADVAEYVHDVEPDAAFTEGVREVVRRTLRAGGPLATVGTTNIPRFVTSQLPDGTWVRTPTPHATVADAIANLEMREAQLAKTTASVESMRQFVALISGGIVDGSRSIGDVLNELVRGISLDGLSS